MRNRLKILSTLRKMKKAYKNGKTVCDYLPLRLWVEATNNCNLSCPMCPNSLPKKVEKGFMKLDTFKKIVDQCHTYVADINLDHRGESLLHDELPAMIFYAKQHKIATRINTNATLLTKEKSAALIQSGLDFISFSIDGVDPESYEKIRKAKFEDVIKNAKNFLILKKKLNSPTPYTMIELLDFPDRKNDPQKIKNFKKRFKSLPLDTIAIKPLHNWGGAISKFNETDVQGRENTPSYPPCTNIWYSMVILWDGTVTICCQDWYNEISLGNIHNSTLENMWNSEPIVAIRDLIAHRQYQQIEICSQCSLLWRPQLKGIPTLNLINFLSENLLGYRRMRKVFQPIEKFLQKRKSLSSRKIE